MTDQEYDTIGAELIEMFGDKLPDPVTNPTQFEFYVKLYKYERFLNEQRITETGPLQANPTEGSVQQEATPDIQGEESTTPEVTDPL